MDNEMIARCGTYCGPAESHSPWLSLYGLLPFSGMSGLPLSHWPRTVTAC